MSYTEDMLIEQPAIKLFADLGWQTLNCYNEQFGKNGLLGRSNRSEVVLLRHLHVVPQKKIESRFICAGDRQCR